MIGNYIYLSRFYDFTISRFNALTINSGRKIIAFFSHVSYRHDDMKRMIFLL